MASISQTIAQLARLRTLRAAGTADLLRDPSQDRLTPFSGFGSNPGALKAYSYVPPHRELRRAPLVVVLHGCTQTAAGYDHGSGWSLLADTYGFAVLFPKQQRINNSNLCFNWFVPEDITRDSGEALSIRQMIDAMIVRHDLDPRRVFITGLSAGGAMTSVMLATYPEVFAGGAIIAGLPYGGATTVPEALARMRAQGTPPERELQSLLHAASPHRGPWPTISVWHGSADHVVAPDNAQAIVAQWRGVHDVSVEPTRTEIVDNYPRRVWRNAGGRDVIEEFTVTGMGHGTPLKTRDAGDVGMPGPFMLDAAISSSLHIATFWGLTDGGSRMATLRPKQQTVAAAPHETQIESIATIGKSEQLPKGGARPPALGIRKTIEEALRLAGLMK
ncbi:PHB depolymerase family esterase [Roseiarcaceae bacterium H3SJ34-1]|uniref:extracellular catalytic domain type 1 short-chain-length polyhydroxyalkanoate depolymerase n=1 Tax=Terripilifer ovatus TaxID=3032367 RepID=UPI003AB924C5|nr:PHB depolymerase family esterase [Roseiarcaceae bacterium H3SJ34-1]